MKTRKKHLEQSKRFNPTTAHRRHQTTPKKDKSPRTQERVPDKIKRKRTPPVSRTAEGKSDCIQRGNRSFNHTKLGPLLIAIQSKGWWQTRPVRALSAGLVRHHRFGWWHNPYAWACSGSYERSLKLRCNEASGLLSFNHKRCCCVTFARQKKSTVNGTPKNLGFFLQGPIFQVWWFRAFNLLQPSNTFAIFPNVMPVERPTGPASLKPASIFVADDRVKTREKAL